MRKILAGLAALLIGLTLGCTADDSPDSPGNGKAPDRAACKSAVNEQLYGPNSEGELPKTTWPQECDGFDQATLDKIVQEIVDER
jgi:hypothetical protein